MRNCLIFVLALMLFSACSNRHPVVEQPLSQGWTLTGDTLDIQLTVAVPSVVQQALYEAGRIAHPYLGTAENDLLWISNHPWTYALDFDANPELMKEAQMDMLLKLQMIFQKE